MGEKTEMDDNGSTNIPSKASAYAEVMSKQFFTLL